MFCSQDLEVINMLKHNFYLANVVIDFIENSVLYVWASKLGVRLQVQKQYTCTKCTRLTFAWPLLSTYIIECKECPACTGTFLIFGSLSVVIIKLHLFIQDRQIVQ